MPQIDMLHLRGCNLWPNDAERLSYIQVGCIPHSTSHPRSAVAGLPQDIISLLHLGRCGSWFLKFFSRGQVRITFRVLRAIHVGRRIDVLLPLNLFKDRFVGSFRFSRINSMLAIPSMLSLLSKTVMRYAIGFIRRPSSPS